VPADGSGQVDDGVGDDSGCLDKLVAGGVEGDGEAGAIGVGAWLADGGVGGRGRAGWVQPGTGVSSGTTWCRPSVGSGSTCGPSSGVVLCELVPPLVLTLCW